MPAWRRPGAELVLVHSATAISIFEPVRIVRWGTSIPDKGDRAEVVWKTGDGLRIHDGGSTGGGVSAVLQRPAWQKILPLNR